jgi:hypothetical protein
MTYSIFFNKIVENVFVVYQIASQKYYVKDQNNANGKTISTLSKKLSLKYSLFLKKGFLYDVLARIKIFYFITVY